MLDKMTEMVAHMIGIFHTTIEEARMRDAYAEFQALLKDHPDPNDLLYVTVHLRSPYALEDFIPSVKYTPAMFQDFVGIPLRNEFTIPVAPQDLMGHFTTAEPDAISSFVPQSSYFVGGRPLLQLEPPGSVVIITFQSSWLNDNDFLSLSDAQTNFTDPAEYLAALHGWHALGQSLGPIPSQPFPDFGESILESALALHDAMADAEGGTVAGASVTVLHGEDAFARIQNGEAVEVFVRLDDVMPAFFRENNPDVTLEPHESGGQQEANSPLADTDPFQGMGGPSSSSPADDFDVEGGHAVVSGANVAVNDAAIFVAWLDAPVIAVMGDVVSLNIISQINVLVEHVTLNGHVQPTQSQTFNIAAMSLESSMPHPSETQADNAQATNLPTNWAVTRIEGDLITVNWVSQFTFSTDFDRADIQFSGSASYIGLGDNTVVNIVDLAEIGYGYDLIIIGGHMITINQISQTNILLDNDTVTGTAHVPFNFAGSDNLLFNGASISTVGIDSYSDLQDNFAAAGEAFAQGAITIDKSVAHDSVFEGDEILTVLYISGDMTSVNMVEQTNVMGDSDQVHLALDNFADATGAPITVTTGSNAVINVASIDVYGVDSQVQTGGEVYTDALLYQAGLIDTDSAPLGVQMPPLANEAVAFLSDDMIELSGDGTDGPVIAATPSESSAADDMMQTMLA